MFDSFGAFNASLQQAWSDAKIPQEKAQLYYEWYKFARQQSQIVIGHSDDLVKLKARYGVAGAGGSMLIGAQTWDIIVNDSWIMGGVHAQVPFLLKTVLDFNNVYKPEQRNNPDQTRVLWATTREIAGLNLFGYQKKSESADGQLFECVQKPAANNANFQDYRIHTQAVAAAALS
jgi:hypothetical protein